MPEKVEDPSKKERRHRREERYYQREVIKEAVLAEFNAKNPERQDRMSKFNFLDNEQHLEERDQWTDSPPFQPTNSQEIDAHVDEIRWDLHIKQSCSFLDFKTDERLNCFTGIHSLVLLGCIEQGINNLSKYTQPSRTTTLKHRIILVFIKMKTNLTFRQLATIFNISDDCCSKYFFELVPVIRAALDFAVKWPTIESNADNMPCHFIPKYVETYVVLDCTENFLKSFKCLHCRALLYSQYKGKQTAKYLIGVTPSGLICYCGLGHCGRASDSHIFDVENIIANIPAGSAVMADKGFFIDEALKQNNSKLFRPPFLRGQKQLTEIQCEENKGIASARVHVERAIQRIRIFKIFNNTCEKNMVGVMDELMFIACAITNLSKPILAQSRFN